MQGVLGDTYNFDSSGNVRGDGKIVNIGTLNVGSNPDFPIFPEDLYRLADLFADPSLPGGIGSVSAPNPRRIAEARVFRTPATL